MNPETEKRDRASAVEMSFGSPMDLQLRFDANGIGTIEGLASPIAPENADFDQADVYGDLIMAGAYRATLENQQKFGAMPAFLFQHDPARPIGKWLRMEERSDGLYVAGKYDLDLEDGRLAYQMARSGTMTGLSIGGYFTAASDRGDGRGRKVRKIDLIEVSQVTLPAAPRARIQSVKSIELTGRPQLTEILRSAGLSRGAAEKIARGGWSALTGQDIDQHDIAQLEREIRSIAAAFRKG